jgi:hypothetical protein
MDVRSLSPFDSRMVEPRKPNADKSFVPRLGPQRPAPPVEVCPRCSRTHWRPDGLTDVCPRCELNRVLAGRSRQMGLIVGAR